MPARNPVKKSTGDRRNQVQVSSPVSEIISETEQQENEQKPKGDRMNKQHVISYRSRNREEGDLVPYLVTEVRVV